MPGVLCMRCSIIMEFCDLGSLDSAISDGRFTTLVRPVSSEPCGAPPCTLLF